VGAPPRSSSGNGPAASVVPRHDGDAGPGQPLRDLQSFMAGAIRRETTLAEHADVREPALRAIAGNERLSPIEQLDIYREQFFLRHIDALYEDFSAVGHLLGWEGFEALGRAYLRARPPDSFTLRDLGARLPDFVAAEAPWKDDALLVDTARIEWAFVEAFDASDAPPLDPGSIARAPEDAWPGAHVVFHPALRRVALRYPAHELRAAVRAKKEKGDDVEVARPEAAPAYVVIYRGPDAKLRYVDVDRDAFELLALLAEGRPLAAACDALGEKLGVADASALEAKVGKWFREWAAYGWVCRVEFGAVT
jgi:hypothetical protein